jgi:dihydrolipoamide dehydrogenase
MTHQFDIAVIGAGPAGYVAAIRAAQLGMKVALIEKRKALGGTCLNVGCIPSKALLSSSEKFEEANHHLADHGIQVGNVKLDVKKLLDRKNSVVQQLTGGIAMLMKKNKITVVEGTATITGEHEVTVGKEKVTAKNILIATGSEPVELPFAKFDGKTVVSSTEALDFTAVPKHLIVIGAGVIGLELGSVWRRLGAEVTLVDIADKPLAVMDKDLATEAGRIFTKQGLKFKLGCGVKSVKANSNGAIVTIEGKDGKKEELKGDKVLVSVGRYANTRNIGLDKIGVKTDNRGVIQVNNKYQTNIPSIYAIGDCIPGPMLAHKGEEEGVACVEIIAGQKAHVDYHAVPSVVYTAPEVAGVGFTEEEARAAGHDIKIGKFMYRANGKALAMNESDGFVKIIADKKTDKLLGMHIIGSHASDMIAEGVAAIEFGASAEDIARTCHAHPTLSEVTKEAALAVEKRAIHS